MTDARSIDHVVIAVDDLDRAAADYEALGFTLTPRTFHEDRMGTSNRLAQLAGRNFIELLEVDRPERLEDHDFGASPPRFSFGAHNRDFVKRRNGMSMLVMAADDARAAVAQFEAAGIETYAPFDFERKATQPDGSQATVAFSLAFATAPSLPGLSFFVCQDRAPQHFWKPTFQTHENGAEAIVAVYLVAAEPAAQLPFLTGFSGGTAEPVDGGYRVRCADGHALLVLTPDGLRARVPDSGLETNGAPRLAGMAIRSSSAEPRVVPAGLACGAFIEWRRE